MESLRLGFFTEIYRPVVNGVVASVDGLADGLRRRGHGVYCIAPRMPGYVEKGTSVFRIPSLPLPTRTPYRLALPLLSRRYLNDVVKRLSLVHVHSPFVTGWMGMRYARRYGMPLVYTYHTQLEAYAHYVPFEPNTTRFAAAQLTRSFANHADAVVVPTPAMAARLRELGVTVRIDVVPSGIDVRHFASGRRDDRLRERFGAGRGDRLLLSVGRLAREKNLELLLSALARANDCSIKLVVAGDGPYRDELERRARRLGVLERTRFAGVIGRENLPDLYASADAFVMPSTTETQGLVLAEALASGAHVIAADAPANREVLGDCGWVVPPTAGAFAAAFARLLPAPEPDLVARRAALRFAIERQIDRMEVLYESLLRQVRIA
jgi:1,2-diacylglycerol 3-alpha-glucosyltransferase